MKFLGAEKIKEIILRRKIQQLKNSFPLLNRNIYNIRNFKFFI
jgi:hypothetical protein